MSILYIVATPIGNLEDISLRALRVLREVEFIICEDTRVTSKLLAHYDIKKPLISYHQHTRLQKVDYIIERLEKGESAALVSDAGTPGISDPGGVLVQHANQRESESELTRIQVVPIPGPNAAITLASVAGIPIGKFLFLGFPPHKKGRKTFFEKVCASDVPVIFYESCHRILKALGELSGASENMVESSGFVPSKNPPLPAQAGHPPLKKGGRIKVIVGRELTKMFETIYRGSVEDVMRELESDKNNLKGEFTIIWTSHSKTALHKL